MRAAADATTGENYGFVVLRKGDVTRRIPYFFLVDKPVLAGETVLPLARTQSGDTRLLTMPGEPFGMAQSEDGQAIVIDDKPVSELNSDGSWML